MTNIPEEQSRSTKIGLITAFPPGEQSLNEFGWHLAKGFAEKPDANVVVYADETDNESSEILPDVPIHKTWRFNSLLTPFRLIKKIRETKPDVVIYNLQFASFGDTKIAGGLGLLTPMISKMLGTPSVVILHNLVENVDMQDAGFAKNRFISRAMTFAGELLTRCLLRADYVALTIPKYVELLQEKYGAENVVLAPHGSFEMLEEPSFERSMDPAKLLAFGKWGTYKKVDMLLDAYRLLRERGYENIEVVIAGSDSPNSPGYLDSVKESCADLPNVTFTGYVAEEDVAGLFGSAAIAVFPYTSTTGSSGVLHQAGSYGCCAVLPDIGDFAEVIEEEGFGGEYFDPHDVESLADALAKLLGDASLREEIGRRNFVAASGIPFVEVLDWHLIHIDTMLRDAGD